MCSSPLTTLVASASLAPPPQHLSCSGELQKLTCPPLTSAEQRGNHTFNLEFGSGLPISAVAAILPGVLTVQILNDQCVDLPLLLDAELLVRADHRGAFLPLHWDVRPGYLTGQVSRATLL